MQPWNVWAEEGMRHVPELIAAFLNGSWPRDIEERWATVQDKPRETRRAVISEMRGFLKLLTDQWIESGKNDAGIEDPWKRSLEWTSSVYRQPISSLLLLFAENNPRVPSIDSDNRMRIDILPASFCANNPVGWANDRAIFDFVMLLNSPTRERLFRCDACSAYYVRAKAPRKDRPIKCGTFCDQCRNKGGKKRTEDRRDRLTQARINCAADAWQIWTASRRQGTRPVWVAKQVTAKLPDADGIKVNWVTRHRKEIEAEVERRKHA